MLRAVIRLIILSCAFALFWIIVELTICFVSRCEMLHFVKSYMKENKSRECAERTGNHLSYKPRSAGKWKDRFMVRGSKVSICQKEPYVLQYLFYFHATALDFLQ